MFEINSYDLKKLIDKNINVYVWICGFKYKLVRCGSDKSLLGYKCRDDITVIKSNERYEITIESN